MGIGTPLADVEGGLHVTTSDDAGRFVISSPGHTGALVAQLGARRSRPSAIANHVTLVLTATRRVTGTVELAGMPYTRLVVRCMDADDPTGRFRIMAPVAPDGSFVIEGAAVGAVRVGISVKTDVGIGGQIEFQTRPASRAPITDLRFELLSSSRTVDVVVRSAVAARLEGAQVAVIPGRHRFRTFGGIDRLPTSSRLDQFADPVIANAAPRSVVDEIRPGDLVAHLEHVIPGEITVCALGFTGDMVDPQVQKRMQDHVTELALRCEPIGPDAVEVVIAVPPQRRFE